MNPSSEYAYWWLSPSDEPDDIAFFLRDVLRTHQLEQPALGITQYALDRGVESLSVKQAAVLHHEVIQMYADSPRCQRCDKDILWSDRLITENLCSECYAERHR